MVVDPVSLADNISNLERKPGHVNAEAEANYLCGLVKENSVFERLLNYTNPIVIGVGGSGLILQATYEPSGSIRVLKFPRNHQYRDAETDPYMVEVDPERKALEKVSHQNITRLYEAFILPNGVSHCMISEYIPGGNDNTLDRFVRKLVCNLACMSSEEQLTRALKKFARIVYEISDALLYLHREAKLLHSDLKPENILISPTGVPYVTDLGCARHLEGNDPDEIVQVGFTWKYAHPRLQDPHRRDTNVPQKAKTSLKESELSEIFDVFAFGRTVQELLGLIFVEYGERIQSNYIFDYLHVLACRCLDKKNGSIANPTKSGEFISDAALGMPLKLYSRTAFGSFVDVRGCLERLLGLRRLEDDLEETDRWYGSTIKITETGSTTLTSRVATIINHPALQRLRRERQLGLLESVYPTATHTRFEHAIGSYHAATLYLSALYYDPENPLFRSLMDIEKCKALLVAALIHDIGQTAYGHELEEIDEEDFDHKYYVKIILNSNSFKDTNGRTLRDIIEKDADGCWGLPLQSVMTVFEVPGPQSAPFDGVLHDVLDSQIDADKFDYLVRDTVEGRVAYGFGIDLDRFLRSLTTFARDDGTLRLAVKQKGAPSAEAFAHARYQLYQSMYWQHTFRATKTMLTEAIKRIQSELLETATADMFDPIPIRTAYIKHVIGATDYSPERTSAATRRRKTQSEGQSGADVIETRLAARAHELPVGFRDDRFMSFLSKLAPDQKTKALLHDLTSRNYYKRLLEVSPARLSRPAWEKFRDRFRKNRTKIQSDVEQTLINALRSKVQSEAQTRETLDVDITLERITAIGNNKVVFLIDVPLRGWFASNEPPIYVSDYKRRHFRAEAADRGFEQRKDFWINMLGDSMKAAAYIRVFCEPEVHSIMVSVMGAKEIFAAVADAVPELGSE